MNDKIEITVEKFSRIYQALLYVIEHPDASKGSGDVSHSEWSRMQRLAKEALL